MKIDYVQKYRARHSKGPRAHWAYSMTGCERGLRGNVVQQEEGKGGGGGEGWSEAGRPPGLSRSLPRFRPLVEGPTG